MTETEPVSIKLEPWLYVLAIVLVLLPIPILLYMGMKDNWSIKEIGIGVLLLVYYAFSVKGVRPDELAGIVAFNSPAFEVESGIYFVPAFLTELGTFQTQTQNDEFPADPEMVSKRRDELGLLPGQMRPIRVTTAGSKPEHGNDPLNNRLTLELAFVVRWKPMAKGFFELYVRIPGATWAEKRLEIRRQMRDTGEVILMTIVPRLNPLELNLALGMLGEKMMERLSPILRAWGIEVVEVGIKPPDFPVAVNVAISEAAEAAARATATIRAAEAQKTSTILKSEGDKEAGFNNALVIEATEAAKGRGLRQAADALDMSPGDFAVLERVTAALKQTDLVVAGTDGFKELTTLGSALKHVATSNRDKKEP